MTIAIIFVVMATLALFSLIWLAQGSSSSASANLENPTARIRSIDIEAFRNLVDPEEEEYLRSHLPWIEFRSIHRERLRAAIEYVACVAGNAAVLMQVGESARRSADPAVAEAGQKLVDNALRLRIQAFQAMIRLGVGIVLPGVRISAAPVAERYEVIAHQGITLGCLHRATA